ncbi:MAG: sodium:proton antiporter [Deltaproteobacteria bacterium]|nr:sodium:proton antiporter [Deltaproteobacteria bacterium]
MLLLMLVPLVLSQAALASGGGEKTSFDLTTHWVGIACVAIFVVSYILVMLEEAIHLRKSKPVLVAAGLIWLLVAWILPKHGAAADFAEHAVRHNLLEYAELFLFLLAAMTYINTMEERRVFDALRAKLVGAGLSLRQIFWVTGLLSFFISPVADNLTTALLMGAVAMSVGAGNVKFVAMACINIVIAANAGGAFSPFGDITTLMVWQKGLIPFSGFFALFLPSVVNWLVPAVVMTFFLEKGQPAALDEEVKILEGGVVVVFMFLGTIALAVSFHNFLHMPPVIGMMTGLGFLKFFGFFLKRRAHSRHTVNATPIGSEFSETGDFDEIGDEVPDEIGPKTTASSNPFEAMSHEGASKEDYDIFKRLEKAEWDTLMFFYGVILCVGGLSTLGYLGNLSTLAYEGMGATTANIGVGFLSAIVDNIPVMFAVLTMMPEMDAGQWLLATLAAGVGGSMLSIGSAAGVALMGQARGIYTFGAHLKWAPVIALGYFAAIGTHYAINMQEPGPIILAPGAKAKAAPAPAHDDNHSATHDK